MCGIVGATGAAAVQATLLEGLSRLEYRGYDSAGIAIQDTSNGTFNRVRVVGKVQQLVDQLEQNPLSGSAGIAHTRWATHGKPSERNSHPHMLDGRLTLVHNGIIENFSELRADITARGGRFESDTDSEVIVHLVAEFIHGGMNLAEAVRRAMSKLEGAFAIGLMSSAEPGQIVAAKRGCPLVIGIGKNANFIGSDVLSLRSFTDRFLFLEDDELVVLDSEQVTIFDGDGNKVDRDTEIVLDQGDRIDKGGYRHFMEKEIHAQPESIRNTLEGRITRSEVVAQTFGIEAVDVLEKTEALTIVGCGTSFYAALVARYWIEDLARVPCDAEIASEFRYRNAALPKNSLFLSLSQSGESADTIAALRLAQTRDYLHTMNIGNVTTSTLMRDSDSAIAMRAGVEVSVASTKAFTTVLVDLLLLALVLARTRGFPREEEREIVRALHTLPEKIEQVLGLKERMQTLAEEFVTKKHVLFLGRGTHYPIAMEGALKLKELSYTHAEGYPAGELKHGPLALVDRKMPVVAVAPSNELLRKVQSNLQEVRARGGKLYVFTDEGTEFVPGPDVTIIEVPTVHRVLSPIVYTIPLQLLAYHIAVHKGTDIDQPRNIAKSVTVE
ncbi:MAG: glutamine--fructose-6-phosphate transaminase (isomerizing) [Gammaproteobacteria bacterium]|nr:glutamine--fructose-6-phosphate transaminase (isomerizing) [Gammaproteobacteria bacterium]MYI77346.1 glutamine--fructose-6-phosphate transaminase (isomerizing) [Gammaproteobacteria bacterium]